MTHSEKGREMSEERWMYRNYSMTGEFIGWSVAPLASLQGELSVGYLHESNVRELKAELEALRHDLERSMANHNATIAELEALRADAAMRKRAVDVIFEDESGDLDYIRWYIATHVLQARKGAA